MFGQRAPTACRTPRIGDPPTGIMLPAQYLVLVPTGGGSNDRPIENRKYRNSERGFAIGGSGHFSTPGMGYFQGR